VRRTLVVVALVAVVAFAAGVLLGSTLDSDDSAAAPAATGLPPAVEATRAALVDAAASGDYQALAPLVPEGFRYTFGAADADGPAAYWQELERTTGEHPLEILAAVLKLPYTLSHGYYVWPWAYSLESAEDLSPHEVELLASLGPPGRFFPEGVGYLGWRAGIAPDGTWAFYASGD
jgi:hypothetical protein